MIMAPVKSSPAEIAFLEKKSSIELAKLYNSSVNKESSMSVTIKSILDARGFDPAIALDSAGAVSAAVPAPAPSAAESKAKAKKAKKAADAKALENVANNAEVSSAGVGVFIAPEMVLTPEQEEAQRLKQEAEEAAKAEQLAQAKELEDKINEAEAEVDEAKALIEKHRGFLTIAMDKLKALRNQAKELKISIPKGSSADINAIRAEYKWAIGQRVTFTKNGTDEVIDGEIKAIDYDKRVGLAMFRIIGHYKIYHKRLNAVTFIDEAAQHIVEAIADQATELDQDLSVFNLVKELDAHADQEAIDDNGTGIELEDNGENSDDMPGTGEEEGYGIEHTEYPAQTEDLGIEQTE